MTNDELGSWMLASMFPLGVGRSTLSVDACFIFSPSLFLSLRERIKVRGFSLNVRY
jgi:hypothetical protein